MPETNNSRSIRHLGFSQSTFRSSCSIGLIFSVIQLLFVYGVYHNELQISGTTAPKISNVTTFVSLKKSEPTNAHEAQRTVVPEVLVLITPAGGLTNIKQRLFDALSSSLRKYADKNVQFTLPWVPVAPIKGPFVPLDTIFNLTVFLNWMSSSGFSYFNESYIFHGIRDDWHRDWNSYFNIMSDWAASLNVTLVREVGNLVPIDTTYGVGAFLVKEDLLHHAGVTSNVLDGCTVHARIEPDWQHYSNGIYYVPLVDILSSIYSSKICEDRNLTILTGSVSEVNQACPSCFLANKSALNYIQAAAVDFHIGVFSLYFSGNMQSSLSRLIMLSKNYNGTFTYSKHDGNICLRQVVMPQKNTSSDHGLLSGVVKRQCVINGTY